MAERHGDHAGYLAHRRRGEQACQPCLDGEAEYKRMERLNAKAQAAKDFAAALESEPAVAEGLDVLADLRENLRFVRAAMRNVKSTRELPALSKQRAELVAQIKNLETAGGRKAANPRDDIAARRAARRANAAS